MYATLLALALAQGPDVPEKQTRVAFAEGTTVYPEWIYYHDDRPKKRPTMQQQLDEMLAKFNNGPNVAHKFKRKRR